MEVAGVVRMLRRSGMIVTALHDGRWSVRGHGLVGVLSATGRWPEDPSPCLYLDRIGSWDRMATARHSGAPPATGSAFRSLRRAVVGRKS